MKGSTNKQSGTSPFFGSGFSKPLRSRPRSDRGWTCWPSSSKGQSACARRVTWLARAGGALYKGGARACFWWGAALVGNVSFGSCVAAALTNAACSIVGWVVGGWGRGGGAHGGRTQPLGSFLMRRGGIALASLWLAKCECACCGSHKMGRPLPAGSVRVSGVDGQLPRRVAVRTSGSKATTFAAGKAAC